MSNSDEQPPLPPQVSLIITLIVIVLIVFPTTIIAQWWLYYSSTILLWDFAQTAVVTYSGLAVLMALLVVVAMRKLSTTTDPEKSEKLVGLVAELVGWIVLLLAFSFSESKEMLNVPRHIYFPMALLGLGLLGTCNFRRFRKTADKTSLVSIFVVAICFIGECYRYITGLEKLTF